MNKFLAAAVMLSALVALSDAQCYVTQLLTGATHCQDATDKTWHAIGSKWRNSLCYDCDCTGCCAGYATPTNIPSDCVSEFDSENCEYIVHKKDDPSVMCPILSAVGK